MTLHPPLFHFSCQHGFGGITRSGCRVVPVTQFAMPGRPRLSWFTDLGELTADDVYALGLQSEHLRCERWSHRFTVTDDTGIIPWKEWLAANPLPLDFVSAFTMGRRPARWFVSDTPTPVRIS